MNMIIHDDGHTNVIGEDALDRLEPSAIAPATTVSTKTNFDLILTNPPFGAQVKLTERPYLPISNSEPGRRQRQKKPRKNQKTEILFIESVWHFLKPGTGRAAVVLPDGILTNSSFNTSATFCWSVFKSGRDQPAADGFQPIIGAGVKSSLVFLRRRGEDEKPKDDEAIFMAVPERSATTPPDGNARTNFPKSSSNTGNSRKTQNLFSSKPRRTASCHALQSSGAKPRIV